MASRWWLAALCAVALAGCDGDADDDDRGVDAAFVDGGASRDGGDDEDDAGRRFDGGSRRDGGRDDDDDAGTRDGGDDDSDALRSVAVQLRGAPANLGQRIEMRLVDGNDRLAAIGVIDALPSGDYDFAFPFAIAGGAHRLDVFADVNDDGTYDAGDQGWRLDVPARGDATIVFNRTDAFTDLATPAFTEPGATFVFAADQMRPNEGQYFEVRVHDDDGRLVGRYVLPEVTWGFFNLALPGIVHDGESYEVEVWADFNGNGQYDAPPTDHAWRYEVEGDEAGARLDFVPHTEFTDVEW